MGDPEETKYCSNCKRDIAAVNYVMHEVHCRRNITLCKHCKEPVPKSELDEHYEEYHVKVRCEQCSKTLEISQLEDHKKDECPKRPAPPCAYCELVFPACEITEHLDYCGSRTEHCPLCGQYIKLKDQIRHEDSRCEFPPRAAPQQPQAGAVNNSAPDEDFANSFAMGELSRMLDDPTISGSGRTRARDRNTANRNNTSIASRTRPKQNVPVLTRNPIPRVARGGGTKKNTSTVPANRAKNTNIQRQAQRTAGRTNTNRQSDVDMDHLLAMHLAQDLQQGDAGAASRNLNNVNLTDPDPFGGSIQDDAVLPCEFCSDLFPMDMLIVHQTGCNPLLAQLRSQDNTLPMEPVPSTSNAHAPLNNNLATRRDRGQGQVPALQPHILQNLNNGSGFEDPGDADYDEDIMLPCEFCDNLFPMEMLVHHQVVCDANHSKTPRVLSPAVNSPPRQAQAWPGVAKNQAARGARVPNRQPDPTLDFLNNRTPNRLSNCHSEIAGFARFDVPVMQHNRKVTNLRPTQNVQGAAKKPLNRTLSEEELRALKNERSQVGRSSDTTGQSRTPKGKTTTRKVTAPQPGTSNSAAPYEPSPARTGRKPGAPTTREPVGAGAFRARPAPRTTATSSATARSRTGAPRTTVTKPPGNGKK